MLGHFPTVLIREQHIGPIARALIPMPMEINM